MAAGGHAQKIHYVLAHPIPGIGPETDKEAAHLGIVREMAKKVVRHSS